MKGPSVGFHLKNNAETYSLAYVDSLNFSWGWISNFLSKSLTTGACKYSLVCCNNLLRLCPPVFLFSLFIYLSLIFSYCTSYLETVIPILQPLYFLTPVFLKIIFNMVGCLMEIKYWGFLHQLGLSLISPFFFPIPSYFTSIFLDPPADVSVHCPSTVLSIVSESWVTSKESGEKSLR